MQNEKFSIRKRLKSFVYAGAGIRQFLASEHNARIHLVATILVAIAAWWLKVTEGEAIALVAAAGLVWVTEILNTCMEKAMDLISVEKDPRIRTIKDMAAGAVLLAALTASIIGLIVFIPKILWISKQIL